MRTPFLGGRSGRPTAARLLRTASLTLAITAGNVTGPARLNAAPTVPFPPLLAALPLFDDGREFTKDESSTSADSALRQILTQLVFRSRDSEIASERAVRQFQQGELTEALTYLQCLFDQVQDSFIWQDDAAGLSSTRQVAARLLNSMGRDAWRAYERIYGPQARLLLKAAQQHNEASLYEQISRRFYHTAAGFEAINWQATRWLDRGEYQLAARVFRRLLDDPVHRSRITETIAQKAAVAVRLSDAQRTRPGPGHGLESPAEGRVYAGRITAAKWSADAPPLEIVDGEPFLLSHHDGDLPRRTPISPSAPFMTPLWSVRLSGTTEPSLERVIRDWQGHQMSQLRPVALAHQGTVIGDTLVLRDYDGLRAIDPSTGKTAWRYRCSTSLAQAAREITELFDSHSSHSPEDGLLRLLLQSYSSNSTLGTLTSDGQLVFAVDSVDIVPKYSSRARQLANRMGSAELGDGQVSPYSNRLLAFEVEPAAVGRDGQNEPVWSVGGAVGAADWFYRMDRNDDGRLAPAELPGSEEQFAALDTDANKEISLREAQAATDAEAAKRTLAGHFFLGPPVPVGDRLFAMTEFDRQLNLVALDTQSGELLWSQGLGFVDRPIDSDPVRHTLSCSPVFADGVLLCPTQLGILVAVDVVDGSLLWAYYYGDDELSLQLGRWSRAAQKSFGHPGFSTVPHVHGDRIVYFPRQSDFLHCVSLSTGERLWKTLRDGAEYVGTVTDGRVLVVGRRVCRGLSLSTGETEWTARLGTPSGRGLRVGSNYLVPLQNGRVATLDIASGREIGLTPVVPTVVSGDVLDEHTGHFVPAPFDGEDNRPADPQPGGWWPGNLIACGDIVLSMGAEEIVAFPQASALLDRVMTELAAAPGSTTNMLLAAELELTLGDLDAAKSYLSTSMTGTLSAEGRERAEQLMRELLYLELQSADAGEFQILRQIEQLARTSLDRGRFLVHKTRWQLRNGDFDGVLESAQQFAALQLSEPLPMVADGTHRVAASSWTAGMVGRLREILGDVELERVAVRVDAAQREVLEADTPERLNVFLSIYRGWPQAGAVRSRLAEKHIARGAVHPAELLLLENRRSSDPATSARATRMLFELWDGMGLADEAAGLLQELDDRYRHVAVGGDQTGQEFVAAYPSHSLTAAALRRLRSGAQPAENVRISQKLWPLSDPEADKAQQSARRTILGSPDSSYELVDQGDPKQGRLQIVHKQAGIEVGEFLAPAPYSSCMLSAPTNAGHFFALGGVGTIYGFSLLEHRREEPLWRLEPKQLGPLAEAIKVGPSGPTYCVLQTRRHLMVVDPATGRLLWQRSDLEPGSGLDSDPIRGLFGDQEVLVLFGSDHVSYTLYRTLTGEEIRRDRLDIDAHRLRERRAFGRKLLYQTGSRTDKRVRLWDPRDDEYLLDEPLDGPLLSTVTPEQELVLLLAGNRLTIIDVAGQRVPVERQLDLEPGERNSISRLEAFGGHRHFFVNLQHRSMATHSRRQTSYATDTTVPIEKIRGDLYAIDRESGEVAWKRTLPHRTVLRPPHLQLPFLITTGLIGDHFKGSTQSLLLEVIDSASGRTIGIDEEMLRDRILRVDYEAGEQRLELRGQRSIITLDFRKVELRVPLGDIVL